MLNGNKFTIEDNNTETLGVLLSQIGSLLGVGAREDGRYYLSDICQSDNAKLWAKYKSFISEKTYSDASTRESDRKSAFYGIALSLASNNNNKYIGRLSFSRSRPQAGSRPVQYNRLRDWDGYNANAKSGVLIKNESSLSYIDTISLETNPDTNDNVTMKDLLQHVWNVRDSSNKLSFFLDELNKFQWAFVDWFGFVHTIGSIYGSKESLFAYLFNRTTDALSININNTYFETEYGGRLDTTYIPAKSGLYQKSYLGLLGWKDDEAQKVLLNSMSFSFNIINPIPVQIDGWCPDMVIGTSARGIGYLRENTESGVLIQCASDDFLFMGFQLKSSTGANMSMSNSVKLLCYTGTTVLPKSIPLALYGQANFEYNITPNGFTGVTTPADGGLSTAWAKGMFYVRMSKLWSILGSSSGGGAYFALSYENTSQSTYQPQLLTPYVWITFKNTGKTVASYGNALKATLPEVTAPDINWDTIKLMN